MGNIRTYCSVAHLTFQILSQSLIKGSKSQEINHTQDQEAAKQVIIQLISFVPQNVFKYVEGRGRQRGSHLIVRPTENQQIRASQQPPRGPEGGPQVEEERAADPRGRRHRPHDARRRRKGSVPSRRGFRLPEPRQGSVRVGRKEGRGRGGGQGRRGEGSRPQGADGRPQDETVRQVRQRHQPRGGGGVVENKTPRFGNTFSCTYIISHIHRQRLLLQYKLLDEVILLRLDLLESLALDPEAFESHLPLHDERVQLLLLLLACLGYGLWTFRTHAQFG